MSTSIQTQKPFFKELSRSPLQSIFEKNNIRVTDTPKTKTIPSEHFLANQNGLDPVFEHDLQDWVVGEFAYGSESLCKESTQGKQEAFIQLKENFATESEVLDFSNLNLESLPPFDVTLPHVKRLVLSHNHFESNIDEVLITVGIYFPNLKVLDIREISLTASDRKDIRDFQKDKRLQILTD